MSIRTADIQKVTGRLRGLRRRVRLLYGIHGLARLLLIAALLVAATYLLDRALVLPRLVRTLLFFGSVCWLAAEALRQIVYPLRKPLGDDDLAAAVELAHPGLRDRLISTVQLARDLESPDFADSRPLAEATIRDTVDEIDRYSFLRSLRPMRVHRLAAGALVAILLIGSYASMNPRYGSVWFRRMIALQDTRWPRLTFLEVVLPQRGRNLFLTREGDREVVTLAAGEDLLVRVKANGKVPDTVRITYDVDASAEESRPRRETRILAQVGKRDFQHTFVGLTESLEFFVTGGDDQRGEPVYRVRVLPPPRVESLALDCRYPPYTGLPDARIEGGNLEAPVGTKVALRLVTNQDVERAFLVLDKDTTVPLEKIDPRTYSGGFVVEGNLLYSFLLQGANSLRNARPVRFSLRAIPDLPPALDVFATGGVDFDATVEAAIPIRVLTTDDYGVASVRLLCRVGRDGPPLDVPMGPDAHLAEGEADPDERTGFPVARKVLSLTLLDLRTLSFPETDSPLEAGDVLYYHVVAEDTHTDPDGAAMPQSKETKPFRIHLVQRSELERKLNDWQVRLKGDIHKIIGAQERLRETIARTAELDTEEDDLAPADAERILDAEIDQNWITNELKRVTRDFHQIFNTYLYNRIESSPLTEKLIGRLQESARRFDVRESERYRLLFRQTPQAERDRSDILGKQITMLELAIEAGEDLSPEATRHLTAARKAPDGSERRRLLLATVEKEDAILARLAALIEKMQEWEDYQEVLQETRELIELQEEIKNRTLREIQKIREQGDRR
jgi:hypothetical protein